MCAYLWMQTLDVNLDTCDFTVVPLLNYTLSSQFMV